MNYETLRSFVNYPFGLEKEEKRIMIEFIESHKLGLGDFGWFLECCYYPLREQISNSEKRAVLIFIDKLEATRMNKDKVLKLIEKLDITIITYRDCEEKVYLRDLLNEIRIEVVKCD